MIRFLLTCRGTVDETIKLNNFLHIKIIQKMDKDSMYDLA